MISMVGFSMFCFVDTIVPPTMPAEESIDMPATPSATAAKVPVAAALSVIYENVLITKLKNVKFENSVTRCEIVKLPMYILFKIAKTHQYCAKCCSKTKGDRSQDETSGYHHFFCNLVIISFHQSSN